MSCLSFISLTKTLALASLNPNTDSHSPPLQSNNNSEIIIPREGSPTLPTTNRRRRRQYRPQLPKPRRPSAIEIERAIGAGRFRDANPRDLEEDRKTVFDMLLLNFTGKYEGPLMKKLRVTGEWVTNQTESKFQASGKWFLLFTFQWVLPIWALSLLVASGAIKLPFSTPFLDELLM